MLHEFLSRIATEYTYERAKPFTGSPFAEFVRKNLAEEAQKQLLFLPYDLSVKASVGQGTWAAVPWLGFFDPIVTETATKGFYVVYLINPLTSEIVLSLLQGTVALDAEFGIMKSRKILSRRAQDIRDRIPEFADLFDSSPIDLGSNDRLPSGYIAGHAFGRTYPAFAFDPDIFYQDFSNMLAAYEELINRGGLTPSDIMEEQSPGTTSVHETRRYVLSQKIERANNVRHKVLTRRGASCEGCGLTPQIHYNYSGPLKNTPLDVHHLAPISAMAEGESRRYTIPDDFLILCPTCHRMIHKQTDPSDLSQLRSKLSFQHLPIK